MVSSAFEARFLQYLQFLQCHFYNAISNFYNFITNALSETNQIRIVSRINI